MTLWPRELRELRVLVRAWHLGVHLCCLLLLLSRFSRVDSVRPHRRQSARLPCPWDSPGKNTGVSCHFLLQCRKVKNESEAVICIEGRKAGVMWSFGYCAQNPHCRGMFPAFLRKHMQPICQFCWSVDNQVRTEKPRSYPFLLPGTSHNLCQSHWVLW